MSAYTVLVVERQPDGAENITTVGLFTAYLYAARSAQVFRDKLDAAGVAADVVRVQVSKYVTKEDYVWKPATQRTEGELIELTRQKKHRNRDPFTSRQADLFASSKSTSARQRLIEAHFAAPNGLTDEEAAKAAGLDLSSEYSTRCSELKRDGLLEDTERTRAGSTGLQRTVRQLTAKGAAYWTQQKAAR